ncbi:Sec-independent protein translocase subunit TatA/TatB [Eisenibacter elegans]|jgi:sec-independent protein translocase protein TatA|uniref:Sec-independent protein translocase subunit TatA/TatB n=1 Tax=Eisenibacter elegans TaxID=997 RepID=UPI0004085256|nr:twin-arginine translocase TatA/TatE family subunit [Eisenibacter elegans]
MELHSILLFFNMGGYEIFLILLVILLLFGAKKIPELARGLGRGIREFKDATREVQNTLEESMRDDEKQAEKKNQ